MPLLKLDNGCLAYGHVPLLDAAEFQLDPGERVALIGRNGTGKSSLLAALAGRAPLDDGTLWLQPGLKLGYVPQEPPFDPELSVFQAVVAGMGETARVLADYHAVSHAMAEADADHDTLLARMEDLQHEMETLGVWAYETRAEQVITRFSLDADAKVGTLSGGQKKRVALAQALAVAPELLLLDEPTNHLDIAAIEWLEDFLLENGVTLLFVTHDRRFLDRAGDTHRRTGSRPAGQLPRQLFRLSAAQGGATGRRGEGKCTLRQTAEGGGSLDPPGRGSAPHARRIPRAAPRPAAHRARRAPRAARPGQTATRRRRQERPSSLRN